MSNIDYSKQKAAILNDDGSVNILSPAPELFDSESMTRASLLNSGVSFEGLSNEDIFKWVVNKDIPEGAKYFVLSDNEIPSSGDFRASWSYDETKGCIVVNMDKARKEHLVKLKSIRLEKLKELDVLSLKALESGDVIGAHDAAQKKQVLRDMPKMIDLSVASTPEELKAIIPDCLL